MTKGKGRILEFFGRWVLRGASVVSVEEVAEQFVSVELAGDAEAQYAPGDKLQILLPDKSVRTFTPIGWDGGRTQLVAFRHGRDTPAMSWLASVKAGQRVRFVGPQRSLTLPDGPVTLIGDETAVAVAAAYRRARGDDITAIFEVDEKLRMQPLLERVGLSDAAVFSRGSHTASALLDVVRPEAVVGMAGGGRMIQRIRADLRGRGNAQFKVKTYWVRGKTGLD